MAWKARVDATASKPLGSTDIQFAVSYYDDADSSTILHVKTFVFKWDSAKSAAQNASDMGNTIVAEGQRAKTAFQLAAGVAALYPPVTTIIAIP